EALARCDARLERVIEAMAGAGMAIDGPDANTNLLVLSDHGHTTNVALERQIVEDLAATGWEAGPEGDFVFAGKAIWARAEARDRIPELAAQLLGHRAVGPLFVREPEGIPGTLGLSAVSQGGVRAPDLLFSPQWEERAHRSGV